MRPGGDVMVRRGFQGHNLLDRSALGRQVSKGDGLISFNEELVHHRVFAADTAFIADAFRVGVFIREGWI